MEGLKIFSFQSWKPQKSFLFTVFWTIKQMAFQIGSVFIKFQKLPSPGAYALLYIYAYIASFNFYWHNNYVGKILPHLIL